MTGQGRKGREKEDNLVALAAQSIGWNYKDLVYNLSQLHWLPSK